MRSTPATKAPMRPRFRLLPLAMVLASSALPCAPLSWADQPRPPVVEAPELARRADLIGQEVVVEGRVRLFQFHKGRGFDEVVLQRSPVVFRLPPRLRTEHAPRAHAVRLRGTLVKEDDQLVYDVTAIDLLPRDLDRLEQAIAALPPHEYARRARWAQWAQSQGKQYSDQELLTRGRAVEAEALRIEADHAPADDRPALWLRLAERAKAHEIPEPEPSALAHRAFRALLDRAQTADDFHRLADQIAAFFPEAKAPKAAVAPGAAAGAYAQDPGGTYRRLSRPDRAALDRQLLADALEAALEHRAAEHPQEARALANHAQTQLPDRPHVAATLQAQALDAAVRDVSALRRADVEANTQALEAQGKAEQARDLKHRWLADQRQRLSPTDAESRLQLAKTYQEMLNDHATAAELYQEALKIDPDYQDAADALIRLGYRKENGQWVEAGAERPNPQSARPPASGPERPRAREDAEDTLKGQTQPEVQAKLGQPDRIAVIASQGIVVEQWIYRGPRGHQYINFRRVPGKPVPIVHAHYLYSPPPSGR